MKKLTSVIAILALSAATGWLAAGYRLKNATVSSVDTKRETAYERVMRTGVLRCGYAAWPPFFVINPNTKELTGIWKDLIDPTIKLVGWKIQYVEMLPEQKVTLLENGKIDATCGDGPWMADAVKYLNFVKPFAYAPVIAYVRVSDERVKTSNDMNNRDLKFVGIDGDLSVDIVQRNFPKATLQTLSTTTDPAQQLMNVVTRKGDVAITDPVTFAAFDKNNPHQLKPGANNQPIAVYGGSFGVSKTEHDLFETLNELTEMALNLGIVDQVLDRHDPNHALFLRTAKSYESK